MNDNELSESVELIKKQLNKLKLDNVCSNLDNIPLVIKTIVLNDNYYKILKNSKQFKYLNIEFDFIDSFSNLKFNDNEIKFLFIVFGDDEISKEIKMQIDSMHKKEIDVMPFVIFSDGYFVIPEGESFGYYKQIDHLNKICKCNKSTVAFKESYFLNNDYKPLELYALALKTLLITKSIHNGMKFINKQLAEKNIFENKISTSDYFYFSIMKNLFVELNKLDELISKKFNEINTIIVGQFNLIERDNLERATSETFPDASSSWLAEEFGYIYIEIENKIRAFIKQIDSSSFVNELKQTIEQTNKLLNFSTNVSILGTFSSGKTTFINTLLKTKLRTSSTHNTSILTEIKYTTGEPKVIFSYKDKINISIIRPNNNDFDIEIKSNIDGTIKDIEINNGMNVIVIEDFKGNIIPFFLGSKKVYRSIKKGQKISKDQKLSEGISNNFNSFYKKCIEIKNLNSIISMIVDNTLIENSLLIKHIESEVLSKKITDKSSIISALKNIKEYVKNTNHIPPDINIELAGLNQVFEVDVESKINNNLLKNEIKLDEFGWKEFQGSENSNISPWAESPACYLLVDKATLYIKNNFLKIAEITDTPGLGSVTDMHDEITEKYIRNTSGILLIMIKLSNQTYIEWFFRILVLISSIYKHKKLDSIFFFCNEFDNYKYNEDQVKEKMKNIVKQIDSFGLSDSNKYLCNLKLVIQKGIEHDDYYGYSSYNRLKEALKFKIGHYGPQKNIDQITNLWYNSIKNILSNYKNKLAGLKSDKNDKTKIIKNLNDYKSKIIKIKKDNDLNINNSINDLNTTLDELCNLDNLFNEDDSWDSDKDLILNNLDDINNELNDNDDTNVIYNNVVNIYSSILRDLNELHLTLPVNKPPQKKLITMPLNSLRNLIDDIINNRPKGIINDIIEFFLKLINAQYSKDKKDEIKNWLIRNTREIKEDIGNYINEINLYLNDFYTSVEKAINERIDILSKDESHSKISDILNESKEFKAYVGEKFDKLKEDIDNLLREAQNNV